MAPRQDQCRVLGNWWDQRDLRRAGGPHDCTQTNSRDWLAPPGSALFTVLAVGGFVWALSVGALHLDAPTISTTTSTGTMVHQVPTRQPKRRPADRDELDDLPAQCRVDRRHAVQGGDVDGPNGVAVGDGQFNVVLGSLATIPPDVITGYDHLWLEITVGIDDRMSHLVQLGCVRWAVQALTSPDESVRTARTDPLGRLAPRTCRIEGCTYTILAISSIVV